MDQFANTLKDLIVHVVVPLFIFLFAILIAVFGPKRLFTFVIVIIMFIVGAYLLGWLPWLSGVG